MPLLLRPTRYTFKMDIAAPTAGLGSALALLAGEAEGFAFDSTLFGGTVAVIDTGTPANNLNDIALNSSNLVQAGTSPKLTLWSDGLLHTTLAGDIAQDFAAGWGMVVEAAATNLVLHASDLTNAAWTKNNATASLTATGPDGVVNSASILTATAANGTALQAITSASSVRNSSVWLKRRTGTGNIDLTQDNGGTWTTQIVTNVWKRFSLASVTSANPTVGIRIVTSGDAVDVFGDQHEVGAVTTSTIVTAGVAGVRNADFLSVPLASIPFDGATGTIIVMYKPYAANDFVVNDSKLWTLSDVSLNERMFLITITADSPDTVVPVIVDGGAVQTAFTGVNLTGSGQKSGFAYAANNVGFVQDAGAEQTDLTATLPTVTTFDIGWGSDFGGEPKNFNGWIYKLIYVPRRMTDVEMQARTSP